MKILLKPLFLAFLLLFLLDQTLEKNGIFLPFIHSYLDDICFVPVLLSLASAIMSIVLFGKNASKFSYRLSLFQIISAVIYAAALFEIILPKYALKYTSDPWDLLAYAVGTVIFILFINPKQQQMSSQKL
ncbi:MAG: magnesium citrate secondary transporter [Sphingobacteriales bacterium]|nr:MAG: magnesium citrate secondary transporter [Sphingobacteriales bacterium]